MKVGDEVYLSPKSEYADGTEYNPLDIKGKITCIYDRIFVYWGNGRTNSYKKEDLILASEYEKENMKDNTPYKTLSDYENSLAEKFMKDENPKGHPSAAILMEIAKEAAINGETVGVNIGNGWLDAKIKAVSDSYFIVEYDQQETPILQSLINIRRKPRTIRIGDYDVPEPKLGLFCPNELLIKFDTKEGAELMLKALQELLGEKK